MPAGWLEPSGTTTRSDTFAMWGRRPQTVNLVRIRGRLSAAAAACLASRRCDRRITRADVLGL